MTTVYPRIYVSSIEAVEGLPFQHLGVVVEYENQVIFYDGRTSTGDGFPVTNPLNGTFGNVVIEKQISTTPLTEQEINDLNLTEVSIPDSSKASTASDIESTYGSFGPELTDNGRTYVDTNFSYDLFSSNSNSAANTLLSVAGIDFRSNLPYPEGDSQNEQFESSNYPAHLTFLDSENDDVITAFSYDSGKYAFRDGAGKDYFIIENGAIAEIEKDSNITEWNNIVLSGYSASEFGDLYLSQEGNDLEILANINGIFYDVVDIEDHFDLTSGTQDFNSRYLFVTENSVAAGDINVANDTLDQSITVHTQIDTRLLYEYFDVFGTVPVIPLSAIKTAYTGQADIQGASVDNLLIGDDAANAITGGGGSDTLFGGAGGDTLIIDASDADNYSYADGGADTDLFSYTGSTNVVIDSTSVQTQSSLAENVEEVQLGTNASDHVYAAFVGWSYDVNNASSMSWVDYSGTTQGLEIDLSGTSSWVVTEDTTLSTDTYSNITNAKAQFIGSTAGDDIIVGDNDAVIWLGSGSDDVTLSGTPSSLDFYYSGGTDTIDLGALVDNVTMDASIDDSDLSFSEVNVGSSSIYADGNSFYKEYNFDLKVTVSGKGSLTLENLMATVHAGADAIFDTADDTYSRNGGAIRLWNNAYYDEENNLVGSGTFAQLEATPFSGANLNGTSSGETLEGQGYADTLNGGSGYDTLYGNGGNDTLNGGDDNDQLYGDFGDDTLNGDAGNDILRGGMGADILRGGLGGDDLYGQGGNDDLDGGDGQDDVYGGFGNDTIASSLGSGNRLYGDAGADSITATGGDGDIYGGDDNDTITFIGSYTVDGGAGDDMISTALLDINGKYINGGDGDDTISITSITADFIDIYGGDGDDTITISAYAGDYLDISGGGGDDTLQYTFDGDYDIDGGDGDDVISTGTGVHNLYGGAGNDSIYLTSDNSSDYDRVDGGLGDDIFYVDANFTHTFITERNNEGFDTLHFGTGVLPEDIYLWIEDNELVIQNGEDDSKRIYIDNDVSHNGETQSDISFFFEQITFEDDALATIDLTGGITMNAPDGSHHVITGTSYDDVIGTGAGSSTTILGGAGDDSITFEESGYVAYTDSPSGAYVNLSDTSQTHNSVTVSSGQAKDGFGDTDTISGAKGVRGSDQDDVLWAAELSSGTSYLYGKDGDDTLYGISGAVRFHDGEGDDEVVGGTGTNTFYIYAGNDTITGNLSASQNLLQYRYSAVNQAVQVNLSSSQQTHGTTTINANSAYDSFGTVDTIINIDDVSGSGFGDIIFGNNLSNFILGREGNDAIYGGDGGDYLEGQEGNDELHGDSGVDTLRGGIGDDELYGGDGGDSLFGEEGNDRIHGGDGNDWIVDTSGNNTLYGDAGDDTFQISVNGSNIIHGGTDFDKITFDNSLIQGIYVDFASNFIDLDNDQVSDVTFTSIEEISGSDYSDMLVGDSGDNELSGNDGDDTINGGDGSDILFGDQGDDIIDGGNGDDTINGGYGDDVIMGGSGNDDLDGGGGNDLIISGDGINDIDGGSINASFSTDTVSYENNAQGVTVVLSPFPIFIPGSADKDGDGNTDDTISNIDNIIGSAYSDDLTIGYDPGTVWAGNGNDLLTGGGQSDVLYGEDGDDTLIGKSGNDTLDGGNGTDIADYSAETSGVVVDMNAGTVVHGTFTDTLVSIEQVKGSDYADEFTDDASSNSWYYGNDGDDIYYFSGGDDTIVETGGSDTLVLPDTVGVEDISFLRYSTAQFDLVVHVDDNDSDPNTKLGTITIVDQFRPPADNQVEKLSIYPHTAGEEVTLTEMYVTTLGGTAGETIYGIDFGANPNDTFFASDVRDVIDAGAGDDIVYSGLGNDYVEGGTGNDWIFGHEGIDELYGGDGDDWIFGDDQNVSYGGDDILYGDAGDDWIYGNKGDDDIFGGADNDVLLGEEGVDELYGDAGDDYLVGGTGNDFLTGGAGSDELYGEAGSDTFIWQAIDLGSSDNLYDFDATVTTGDKLDISDLLVGYDDQTDAITDFVQITDDGTDSTLAVDVDGGADNFVTIATLYGITGLTDEATLETNNTLITS